MGESRETIRISSGADMCPTIVRQTRAPTPRPDAQLISVAGRSGCSGRCTRQPSARSGWSRGHAGCGSGSSTTYRPSGLSSASRSGRSGSRWDLPGRQRRMRGQTGPPALLLREPGLRGSGDERDPLVAAQMSLSDLLNRVLSTPQIHVAVAAMPSSPARPLRRPPASTDRVSSASATRPTRSPRRAVPAGHRAAVRRAASNADEESGRPVPEPGPGLMSGCTTTLVATCSRVASAQLA
jgi:hypothetical protein